MELRIARTCAEARTMRSGGRLQKGHGAMNSDSWWLQIGVRLASARGQREIAVPFQEIFSVSKVWPVADSPKVCRTRISACGRLADNNSLPGILRKPARRINSAG
jgi:hypothetical protein